MSSRPNSKYSEPGATEIESGKETTGAFDLNVVDALNNTFAVTRRNIISYTMNQPGTAFDGVDEIGLPVNIIGSADTYRKWISIPIDGRVVPGRDIIVCVAANQVAAATITVRAEIADKSDETTLL